MTRSELATKYRVWLTEESDRLLREKKIFETNQTRIKDKNIMKVYTSARLRIIRNSVILLNSFYQNKEPTSDKISLKEGNKLLTDIDSAPVSNRYFLTSVRCLAEKMAATRTFQISMMNKILRIIFSPAFRRCI